MSRLPVDFIASIGLAILISGCSQADKSAPKTVAAKGKVTYKNAPVDGATVSFIGGEGTRPALALTEPDGTFVLTTSRSGDGAVAGKYRVSISKIVGKATPAKTNMTMEEAAKAAQEPAPEKALSMLPDKYANIETSGLQFEVKPSGDNNFDIPLTD